MTKRQLIARLATVLLAAIGYVEAYASERNLEASILCELIYQEVGIVQQFNRMYFSGEHN